ncbi:MAG: peptidylprolyl isomerase [Clostridiales Family XIII bacterium]|jgi:parvulin-like peptidyl-prolyl isomerase|nr:peptidylprolyl isomerase [Clostridiales Family XIII bacterium]
MRSNFICRKNALKKAVSLVLIMMLLLAFTGCGKSEDGGGPNSGTGESGGDGDSVARVGDVYISEDALDVYAELLIISQGYDLDQVTDDEERTLIKESVLDYMVQIEVMREYFAGQDVLPEDFEEQLEGFISELSANADIMSGFEQKGINNDTLRYYMESQYYQTALSDEATELNTLPTQEEIEKFYYEHQLEFVSQEERRVSHILVGTAELLDADRQLINEIRERIASGTATFEEMAAEYGTDGTKDTGGDLDYAQKGAYVEPFNTVAFSLAVGELSDVIETQFGFHILKVTDIRPANQQTLEEATEVIRQEIQLQLVDARITELVNAADVEYLTDKYTSPESRGTDSFGVPELDIIDEP